jgi:hypothetical protein
MRRFLIVSAFATLVALPVFSASAAPPLVETFHDEGSFTFAGPCPNGVTLEGSFTDDLRVTTFFDNAGNPVRLQIKLDHAGVITNPATGLSVNDPAHTTTFVDLVTGTATQVGLVFKSTVPGVGVVFHDVGRVVFDAENNVIFEAGPHDVLHTESDHAVRDNFCKALT